MESDCTVFLFVCKDLDARKYSGCNFQKPVIWSFQKLVLNFMFSWKIMENISAIRSDSEKWHWRHLLGFQRNLLSWITVFNPLWQAGCSKLMGSFWGSLARTRIFDFKIWNKTTWTGYCTSASAHGSKIAWANVLGWVLIIINHYWGKIGGNMYPGLFHMKMLLVTCKD